MNNFEVVPWFEYGNEVGRWLRVRIHVGSRSWTLGWSCGLNRFAHNSAFKGAVQAAPAVVASAFDHMRRITSSC